MAETASGVLRRGSDRIIAGVCSGLGHYFDIDPILVRMVFVVLTIANGIGILIYLVLWFLMDPPAAPAGNRSAGDRLRSMGDEIREDFRTGFNRSSTTTVPPATAEGAAPSEPVSPGDPIAPEHVRRRRGLWFGGGLILIGALLLLDNMGLFFGFQWHLFWPVILIAIGLFFLLRRH